MQTFLPLDSYVDSARVLDVKRLGKQRVETLQILRTLRGLSDGWARHPAVRMWAPYPQALATYGFWICQEWQDRGYRDTCQEKILSLAQDGWLTAPYPHFMGMPEYHASHRAALLMKDPLHYGRFGWSETPRLQYVWPVKEYVQ